LIRGREAPLMVAVIGRTAWRARSLVVGLGASPLSPRESTDPRDAAVTFVMIGIRHA